MNSKTVIFTDLDGSLLDHHTYSFEEADDALRELNKRGIPLICTTSKTFPELLRIREQLNNSCPMIVENGAAIYIPDDCFDASLIDGLKNKRKTDGYICISFSKDRDYWLEQLALLDFDSSLWKSFSEMGVNGIVENTGLSEERARFANLREFSEPLLWLGDENQKEAFVAALKLWGINVLEGGRFLHLTDMIDKGKALEFLCELYSRQYQCDIRSIALGDGKNDLPMIAIADDGVLIRSQVNPLPEHASLDNVYVTQAAGPKGWSEAIEKLVINAPLAGS